MLERRSILSVLLMITFTSRISSTSEWVLGGAMTVVAGGFGLSATNAFSSRTLSVLPLDTRDINRATWLLAVGLPVLLLTAGRVLSASIFAPFEDPWSWVFPATPVRVFYECLFFAMVGAWEVLVPDRHSPECQDSDLFGIVLAVLGIMAVPFVVLLYLPATFAGISTLGWLLTSVAIALAFTPLFLSPKQFVRPEPPRLALETAPTKSAGTAAAAGPVEARRFTGLWALMPRVMAHAVGWSVVFMTFQLAMQWARNSQPMLQPFAPDMSAVRFMQGVCLLMLFVIGMMPGLGQRVPMLKLLPIPATRAAAALTLAPTLTPIVFWVALILMHVAVSTAWPATLRLEYLLLLAGLTALVDALGIKSGSQTGKAAIGFPIIVVLAYALDGDRTSLELVLQHWLVPVMGVASLALAYALNFHTMTRSQRASRAYRYGRTRMPQGAQ